MRLSDAQEANSAIWNALESNIERTLHQLQDEYDDNAEESFASTEAWLEAELDEKWLPWLTIKIMSVF